MATTAILLSPLLVVLTKGPSCLLQSFNLLFPFHGIKCAKNGILHFFPNIKKVAGKTSGERGEPRRARGTGAVRRGGVGLGWGGVLPLSGDARVTSMAPSTSCLKRVQSELRKLRDADLKEFALKRENARLVQGCDGVIQIDQTIWLRQDDELDLTRFTALICGVEGKVSSISKAVLFDSDDTLALLRSQHRDSLRVWHVLVFGEDSR